MICWFDLKPWHENLKEVPAALHAREIERRRQHLNSIIPITAGGTADGIDWAQIALNSFDRHTLFNFFEASGTCAVTLEASDFFYLYGGKNLVSLVATRAAQNGQLNIPDRIGVDELSDLLDEIRRACVNGTPSNEEDYYGTPELDRAMAEEDLVASGLLSRDDLDANTLWENRDLAKIGEQNERDEAETREYIRQVEREVFDPFSSDGSSW